MFPTTLAALGVKIPGDMLGFGVNLFSDKKTLLEEACKNYLTEQKVNNPTLDICRDAYLLHQNIDAYRCDSSQMKTSQGEYYAIKTHKLKNLIGIYKELKEL